MKRKLVKYLILLVIVFTLGITCIYKFMNPKEINNEIKLYKESNYIDLNQIVNKSNIITNVFTLNELKQKLKTNGEIRVTKNGKEVTVLSTGCDVEVIFIDKTYRYKVAVPGDITGNGKTTVSDVAKLYQYMKGVIQLEEYYKVAGNIAGSANDVSVTDVAKLYQYSKGLLSDVSNKSLVSDNIEIQSIKINSENITMKKK